MRTNNTIISLATMFAMVLVSSCTKTDIESELESTKSQLLYVTADIAKDAASRVSMEAVTDGESTTINLDWEDTGETFDVIDANNIVVAKFKQTDNTTDEPNKFVGQLTNATGQAEGEYRVVYPSAEALDLSVQNGTLDNSKIRMCGTYTGTLSEITNVEFTTHKTAIIKLHFKINDEYVDVKQIRRVVVKDVQNQILFYDGEPRTGNITINKETDDQDVIYLNIPATAKDTNINFAVTTTSASYNGTLTPSKDIEAGTFYNAAITLNESSAAEYNSETTATESEDIIGEGTAGDPYLITSAEDLQWLVTYYNDENLSSPQYYKLATDINIDSSAADPWTFALAKAFTDILDGANHEITGKLYAVAGNLQPIIGFVCQNAGVVKNLNVDVEVVGSGALTEMMGETGSLAGGVVGANLGTIDNCTSKGSIRSEDITEGEDLAVGVGGIAGLNAGTITNSTNNATVQGTNLINGASGWSSAGGIAGIVADGKFDKCHNKGDITACRVTSSGNIGGVSLAGGIFGHGARRAGEGIIVTDCTNSGTISGTTNTSNLNSRIGGIIGNLTDVADSATPAQDDSRIEDCTNSGDVSGGYATGYGMTGGIIGTHWMTDIVNCTNTSDATITACNGCSRSAVGGIAGWVTGDSHDSPWYFMKNFPGITTTMSGCDNAGQINGADKADEQYVGGIIGELLDGHNFVYDCENTGNINANGSIQCTISGVGGIIGRTCAGWASVYECTNNGSLTDVAKVYNISAIGGISGICNRVDDPDEINSGLNAEEPKRVDRIYDCANTGQIIVPTPQETIYVYSNKYLGGVVGYLETEGTYDPEVCSCCVDNNAENATNGYPKIGNNVALTEKCNDCTSTTP